MLTTIDQASVQRTGVNAVDVGQVAIGPIRIGRLVLTSVSLSTAAASAELSNFRVTISQQMTLDWHLHIDIPGFPVDDSGSEDLGTPTFSCDFGGVRIPGLENLKIDIATLAADSVAATAAPLSGLQLGSLVAEQIQAHKVTLPTSGFTIAGLGLGALRLGGVGVPSANVESLSIGRVHGEAFPLPNVTLSNVALPAASVADIVSQSVDAVATPLGKAFHLDLGCLDLTLKVKPRAEAQIDRLTIAGVSLGASVGSIELQNVVAPYELLNLTLSQIGIDTIQVPTLALA